MIKNTPLISKKGGQRPQNRLYFYNHLLGVANDLGGNYVKIHPHGNDRPVVDHLNRKFGND